METVYIFTHIPKTAGTSLRIHFAKYLENHIEFIHLANRGHKQAKAKGLKSFYERNIAERNKAKVILGHQVNKYTKELTSKKPEEIVIFRNPVEWEISRFNQYANRLMKKQNKLLTLDDWLTKEKKVHSQFDWFLVNYSQLKQRDLSVSYEKKIEIIKQEISHYKYILAINNIEEKLNPLFRRLNIPDKIDKFNAVGVDKKPYFNRTIENIDKLKSFCKTEVEIYETLIYENIIIT